GGVKKKSRKLNERKELVISRKRT
ncbi:hypothetical protein CSUI_001987, partial [Cystoisospora suis]